MWLELVTMVDERGVAIWFVDFRISGTLADSRFFASEREAWEFLSMQRGA
jgi:hypothetical protein